MGRHEVPEEGGVTEKDFGGNALQRRNEGGPSGDDIFMYDLHLWARTNLVEMEYISEQKIQHTKRLTNTDRGKLQRPGTSPSKSLHRSRFVTCENLCLEIPSLVLTTRSFFPFLIDVLYFNVRKDASPTSLLKNAPHEFNLGYDYCLSILSTCGVGRQLRAVYLTSVARLEGKRGKRQGTERRQGQKVRKRR